MTLPKYFTFTCPRYGDTYNIDLNDDGEFLSAVRYVDRVPSDPIAYTQLSELPQIHRHQIEEIIYRRKQKQK